MKLDLRCALLELYLRAKLILEQGLHVNDIAKGHVVQPDKLGGFEQRCEA